MNARLSLAVPCALVSVLVLSCQRAERIVSTASTSFPVPDARERLAIRRAIVDEKLQLALTPALRESGADMWIVVDRENNPDPLHEDLGGGYAGDGAAFVFFDRGTGDAERIYIGAQPQPLDSPVAKSYQDKRYYGGDSTAFRRMLRDVVVERQPRRLAVNMSPRAGGADGLTASLRALLGEAVGRTYSNRVVSAERLVHAFRARRVPTEMRWYRELQAWTDRWESEGLASVRAGDTTVLDLASRLEDRARRIGLAQVVDHGRFPLIVWFGDQASMPGLSGFERSRRAGAEPAAGAREVTIEAGDLITLDGGLSALGLATDMKRSAYILKADESDAPRNLQVAWAQTLKVADLYASRMRPGASGRQMWSEVMEAVKAWGFEAESHSATGAQISIYGHSTGNVVHDVGPRVAEPNATTSGNEELTLVEGEWVSIEFHLTTPVQAGKKWYTRFEQTAQVTARGAEWIVPRQERLTIIQSKAR